MEDNINDNDNTNDTDGKEEYNNLVQELGTWIDDEFLKTLIHMNFGNEVEIVDHDIQSAVNAGDNYLSILYRTTVKYTNKDSDEIVTKKFMIKGVPPSQTVVDMIEDMGVFQKEIFMYDNYLPAMRYIMKQYFPIHTPNVAPNCYKCGRRNTIVMEDLGESNYRMGKRRKQLDFKHSSAVVKSLAQFHALSLKVFEENPEFIEPLSEDVFVDKGNFDSFIDGAFPELAKIVETWDECAHLVPILNDMTSAIKNKVTAQLLRPSTYLNVLNHGDVWVNNIMFRYNNEGSVDHAKLVDYQVTRFSSTVLDIQYFLFTSVQVDVFIEKMGQLLEIYHSTLLKSLEYLDINTDYTFEKFKEEYEDRLAFGIFSLAICRPIVLAKKKVDISGDEEHENGDHPLAENFKNPLYKDSTIELLLYLDSVGYMDIISKNLKQFLQSKLEDSDNNERTRASTAKIDSEDEKSFLDRIITSISKMIKEPICT